LDATRTAFRKIIKLVLEAAEIARAVDIHNLLQPGLVKELIIADILGHRPITTKHGPDACDPKDPTILYEYLSCKEGGSGQLDRVFKEPLVKRKESLLRISRNRKIYFAVFYSSNQAKVKVIYELESKVVRAETIRKLDRSRNDISHVGFRESWVKQNGKEVYPDPDHKPLTSQSGG
jgi:hypothetical protein